MTEEHSNLSRLNRRLRDCFLQDDLLRKVSDFPYFWSGQQFRGGLCLKIGRCLGVDPRIATEVALFTELLHNASLIHDDIIDLDEQRRGHATIWKKIGKAKAILIGDLLIAKAFEIALTSEVSHDVHASWGSIISQTVLHAVKGAYYELDFDICDESDILNNYYEMATLKTGSLFSLPVKCLASIAMLSKRDSTQLSEHFSRLAVAYQIRDDQSDFYSLKRGRKNSSDIANNRPNIYHLMSSAEGNKYKFEKIIHTYHNSLVTSAVEGLYDINKSLKGFVEKDMLSFVQLHKRVSTNSPQLTTVF